jgi:hypothetical protein
LSVLPQPSTVALRPGLSRLFCFAVAELDGRDAGHRAAQVVSPFRGFWDTQSKFDCMFSDVMRDFLDIRVSPSVRPTASPFARFTKAW